MNDTRPSPAWRAPTLWWGGIVVAALVLGWYAGPTGQSGLQGPMLPRVPAPAPDLKSLLFLLGVGSPVWFAAAAAAPMLAYGIRRVEPDRLGWPRALALAALVLLLLVLASGVLTYFVVYGGTGLGPPIDRYLAVTAPRYVLPWVALCGVIALVEARRRTLRSGLERERLRGALAEQRLLTLTAQLHPHFLFNTLQGISTLIHRDPAAADELLARLSDLLREVLRHRDRASVRLADELRLARTYLEITRLRFADRFTFAIDVPDDLHDAIVPLFVLQPLIENAVTHGIGESLDGGHLVLRGRARDGRLILEVEDDGAGLDAGAPGREGVGLGNTRARLAASYGADFSLTLAPGERGAVARLIVPLAAVGGPGS